MACPFIRERFSAEFCGWPADADCSYLVDGALGAEEAPVLFRSYSLPDLPGGL